MMRSKHLVYYKVLEAFDAPGCPVCRLMEAGVRRRMDTLLYEQVNDAGVRRRLVASRGFCREHSQLLLELGHPLGVALMYQDVIDAVFDDLRSRYRLRHRSKSPSACVACEWAENDEHLYLSVLVEHFTDPEMHSRVSGRRGICVPHLMKLLRLLPPDQQSELTQVALSHLSELRAELGEIVRKSDYRCEEQPGKESDAWIRVVTKLSGANSADSSK